MSRLPLAVAVASLAALLCGCAEIQTFDAKDHARMVAVYTAIATDAATTMRIASARDGIEETGPITRPILGPRPNAAAVAAFAVAESFIARAVMHRLKPRARRIAQYFLIADHTLLGVANNCRLGLC